MLNLKTLFRLDLRALMLMLVLAATASAGLITFYTSYNVQRDVLIETELQSNKALAEHIAGSVDEFVQTAKFSLAYSGYQLGRTWGDEEAHYRELDHLLNAEELFNSVYIVDNRGQVVMALGTASYLLGKNLVDMDVKFAKKALKEHVSFISKPVLTSKKRFLVIASAPVYSSRGRYLGFVAGTIYLHHTNTLGRLVSSEVNLSGHYCYVVDADGQILYHPDLQRVGEKVAGNSAVKAIMAGGNAGSIEVKNSHQVDMLAGFATVPNSGWGVVVQTPKQLTLQKLDAQKQQAIKTIMPIALVALILVWVFAYLITRPLLKLALCADSLAEDRPVSNIGKVSAWYYEARLLKSALKRSSSQLKTTISRLSTETLTDPMTALYNRRGLQELVVRIKQSSLNVSIIALDIDHFKQVNDRYGHEVGDRVIHNLAKLMQQSSREGDLLFRSGGEEFLILLPGRPVSAAYSCAERLRETVENYHEPDLPAITLSAGIAFWEVGGESFEQCLREADRALYSAKAQGRNQVVIAAQ